MRIFSGIKPTGEATLGTILGAVKNWTETQGPDSFYCIVDLHAITVPQDPTILRRLTYEIAATFIAVGIDPEKTNIFVQSRVPEHNQLGWILECASSFGELSRMTQFKDKYAKSKAVSGGLFTYPALMAADILLYDTDRVPVGEDQVQHVELTRDLAQRFNARYGDTFKLPKAYIREAGARIRDLQEPTTKMSKSEDSRGTILLTDSIDDIRRKVIRAVTDTELEVRYDMANKPGVSNLLGIYGSICNVEPRDAAEKFSSYKELKETVADVVCEYLAPIKSRYNELMADPMALEPILATGQEKAQRIASETLGRASKAVGFI